MTPEGSRQFSYGIMHKESMVPKSVQRFSDDIMHKEKIRK
jgi:hypothetical protein